MKSPIYLRIPAANVPQVRCDVTLVKKLIMSFVFAVDNLLDGFGLAPVLKEAFGNAWIPVMCSFSACVLGGGAFTAFLRWAIPSPVLHLIFISLATTSILVYSHLGPRPN